jgi:hypothetical protein
MLTRLRMRVNGSMREDSSMRRSNSRDKWVFWPGATSVFVVGFVAGWFGFSWPYYVAFVVALVAFQVWYFRHSLRVKWYRWHSG